MSEPSGTVDYRELMFKLEGVVGAIERGEDSRETIHSAADEIIRQFRDELGIYGGRLYHREGDSYRLLATFPDAKDVEEGLRIPRTYPPVALCLKHGCVYIEKDDPLIDAELEEELGVESFAAVELGDEDYLLGLDVAPGRKESDILFALNVIRHSINRQLRRRRIEGVFEQARQIHESILPRRPPEFPGFDIAGRNRSMASVGGDLFDFIPVSKKVLGVVVADVTGHGLPAALQVRDVYTGMRMGNARDFKIVRTVERLNRIIHGSTVSGRFVSMCYGELEQNGTFIYVNAGHPPPFHVTAGGEVRRLTAGGPVLGPIADAAYDRGFVFLGPGDILVLYTDGITEALGRERPEDPLEELGMDRLAELARMHRGKSSAEILDVVFQAVETWTGGVKIQDDLTLVVITYTGS